MSEYGHKVQVFSADWGAAHARIASLEARCRELEATLRNVQSALKSDSIECDDMRVIDEMINDALAGFTPETKADET